LQKEEANAAKHLLKPAKADRRQLPGGLLLGSKELAKLYQKCEEQDTKKLEAGEKRQAKRSAAKSTTAASSKKTKVSYRQRELDPESDGDGSNTLGSTGIHVVTDNEVVAKICYT